MIKTDDVVKYIEKIYGVDLFDYQIKLLDNIIQGKITDTPRGCGKSFLIKGYCDYLNYVHDMCKYDSSIITDDYISGTEVIHTKPSLLSIKIVKQAFMANPDMARREFNIGYLSMLRIDEEATKG
jgi:hypothetical protein